MSTHPIELIVGLGNPGPQYQQTRHNVGAWLVDLLAQRAGEKLRNEKKFCGDIAKIKVNNHSCWLLRPQTFMNESGKAIAALARFYKIPPAAIVVAHDELDFPAGTIRIKYQGGHGGHNGLRDTIAALQSNDFYRLRIGIGHPGNKEDVSPYVLSKPSKHDEERILRSIDEGVCALDELLAGNIDRAFQQLHSN